VSLLEVLEVGRFLFRFLLPMDTLIVGLDLASRVSFVKWIWRKCMIMQIDHANWDFYCICLGSVALEENGAHG
jgi:hypothetical protein